MKKRMNWIGFAKEQCFQFGVKELWRLDRWQGETERFEFVRIG